MFGLSLIASLIVITLIWARLARHRVGPAGMVPTLSGLTLHTGSAVLRVLAAVYYAFLVAAWVLVAVRTFHGSALRGTLLVPAGTTPRPNGQA